MRNTLWVLRNIFLISLRPMNGSFLNLCPKTIMSTWGLYISPSKKSWGLQIPGHQQLFLDYNRHLLCQLATERPPILWLQ